MKELRKPLIKALIAAWALFGGSLSLLLTGYASNVPVAKYFFTVLESLKGGGVECLFAFLGFAVLFYLVRDRQKNPGISVLAAFLTLGTLVGISYEKTGSWDCIFLYGTQFLLALFVGSGYYFLYKNLFLFLQYIYERKREWFGSELKERDRLARVLFERHSLLGPFVFLMLFGLPWVIAFCPGTLQWDAHGQLWMALGVTEQTSYHPVFITNYMGGCIKLGRALLHSDSAGLFIYTFPQLAVQDLVFAYALHTMKKRNVPLIFKWGALLFWGVFPYFQIWGFTMVKDTPYYIGFVLFMTVILDATDGEGKTAGTVKDVKLSSCILLAVSVAFMVYARNDGRYVVVMGLAAIGAVYRKYWKLWGTGLAVCVVLLFLEEGVYMPAHGIGKGPVGEMLSVPLQQTARYLRDHYDEVTPEEKEILQAGFDVDISEIGGKYKGEISDPVKLHFAKNPDSSYLKAYFAVWFAQFQKHPDTYVQAFLNQTYGYYYPGYPNYGDYLIFSYIGNTDHWQDGTLDIQFTVKSGMLRDFLRHLVYVAEQMPVLSCFYGCGIYTAGMLYGIAALTTQKRYRQLVLLAPAVLILLICMVSPVGGYLRYMMPVMAAFPCGVMWFWRPGNEAVRG